MSRFVLTDADFLCDRHAVLNDAIKWTHVLVNQRGKNIALIIFNISQNACIRNIGTGQYKYRIFSNLIRTLFTVSEG